MNVINFANFNSSTVPHIGEVVKSNPIPLVSRINEAIACLFQWIGSLFESIGLRRVSEHSEPQESVASENSLKNRNITSQKIMLNLFVASLYLGLIYYNFKPEIDGMRDMASGYVSQQLLAPSPTAEYLIKCASYAPKDEIGYAQGVLGCAKNGFGSLSEDSQNGVKFLRKLAAKFHPDKGGNLEASRILLTALQTLRSFGSSIS